MPRAATEQDRLAFPPRAVPRLIPTPVARASDVRATTSANRAALRRVIAAAAAGSLGYVALIVLLFSPAIRVYDAGFLPHWAALRTFAYGLAPNALLDGHAHSGATLVAMLSYVAVAALVFGSWFHSVRSARAVEVCSLWTLLLITAALATPVLFVPGLVSDDLYLYDLYGRTLSVYGANPVLTPPAAFPTDPRLPWVHWKELPSAYGPIWLILSGVLSALASTSLTGTVFVYRLAGLALHLAVVSVLWRLLRERRPSSALPGTIFYAWNPLVLLEVVANAHNDVLVALFAVLLIGAAAQRRWSRAAMYGACAVMVKPFAVVLLPAVARHLWLQCDERRRYRHLAIATGVAAATVLALSLPLWSGIALIRNAMNNPAASMYTNTLWELMSEAGPRWFGVSTVDVQHPYLDVLRGITFVAGIAWVLTRRPSRRDVPRVGIRLWLVFCLTACWVWPWYFVPVLALAPLAGAAYLPTATALTVGGLLFWTGWPERTIAPLGFLYHWRSLLLFGPLLVIWSWSPARALVLAALGFRDRPRPEGNGVDGRLQTAAG